MKKKDVVSIPNPLEHLQWFIPLVMILFLLGFAIPDYFGNCYSTTKEVTIIEKVSYGDWQYIKVQNDDTVRRIEVNDAMFLSVKKGDKLRLHKGMSMLFTKYWVEKTYE